MNINYYLFTIFLFNKLCHQAIHNKLKIIKQSRYYVTFVSKQETLWAKWATSKTFLIKYLPNKLT